jgi:ubiquinone/menaquinone biosynthesis C-methylase UbiE
MREAMRAASGMSSTEIETMRAVEDELWWYRALRGHVVDSLPRARSHFDLLDAGCGTGGMLARVREHCPQAVLTGLDFSERAIELTRLRETGATLALGSVDALPFADASFDVVLSLDVIIVGGVDEQRALAEMHRVLRRGGMLILNLPAFDFLRGSHDVAVNTARRFNRPRLARLLRAASFTVEHATYWNLSLLPAVAAVRWLSRRRAHQPQVASDLKPMWPPLNAALATLAKSELAISRRVPLPFGTSLFAVARK